MSGVSVWHNPNGSVILLFIDNVGNFLQYKCSHGCQTEPQTMYIVGPSDASRINLIGPCPSMVISRYLQQLALCLKPQEPLLGIIIEVQLLFQLLISCHFCRHYIPHSKAVQDESDVFKVYISSANTPLLTLKQCFALFMCVCASTATVFRIVHKHIIMYRVLNTFSVDFHSEMLT